MGARPPGRRPRGAGELPLHPRRHDRDRRRDWLPAARQHLARCAEEVVQGVLQRVREGPAVARPRQAQPQRRAQRPHARARQARLGPLRRCWARRPPRSAHRTAHQRRPLRALPQRRAHRRDVPQAPLRDRRRLSLQEPLPRRPRLPGRHRRELPAPLRWAARLRTRPGRPRCGGLRRPRRLCRPAQPDAERPLCRDARSRLRREQLSEDPRHRRAHGLMGRLLVPQKQLLPLVRRRHAPVDLPPLRLRQLLRRRLRGRRLGAA